MKSNRKRITGVPLFIYLALFSVSSQTCSQAGNRPERNRSKPDFIDSEADADFLITQDSSVIFPVNEATVCRLFRFKDNTLKKEDSGLKDSFHPFCFENKIICLQDAYGDENFQPSDSVLRRMFKGKSVEKVYSFENGGILALKFKDDNALSMVSYPGKNAKAELRFLCNINETLNGIVYDKKQRQLIVSHDAVFEAVNIDPAQNKQFDGGIPGEKYNMFLDDGIIYFSSNANTDFFSVYRLNYRSENSQAELLISGSHDLRMPKIKGTDLYYVEVSDNRYLLKSLNLKNHITHEITRAGVVYNYDFFPGQRVVYSYSGPQTPRTIRIYNSKNDSDEDILHHKDHPDTINYRLIQREDSSSTAYLLETNHAEPAMGTILFIHPGLHSDFSPKWDFITANLCMRGFKVLAPNYPMSSGFGKKYANMDLTDAANDIKLWTSWIARNNNMPIYYLSSSSGNVLMEQLLTDPELPVTVVAAASLFGIPGVGTDYDKITVPSLYILGRNDPSFNYKDRFRVLETASAHSPLQIKTFPDEGHWCRKQANLTELIAAVSAHFSKK